MKNKLFLAGIIIVLIFGIVGMGCDGGGSIGGGGSGGGSGGSGGSGGGSGGSGGSGGGSIGGGSSGSGKNKDSHDVKFVVTSTMSYIQAEINYSYPVENYSYSGTTNTTIYQSHTEILPWEKTVTVSDRVIGRGVSLSAQLFFEAPITVSIYIDGKKKASNSGEGYASVYY